MAYGRIGSDGSTVEAISDTRKREINDGNRRATPPAFTSAAGPTVALVRDTHANIDLEFNSSTALNVDMPASATVGDEFRGLNLGAGVLTLRLSGGGAITGNAILPTTVAQNDAWLVRFTSLGYRRIA